MKIYATKQGMYSAVDADGQTVALIINTDLQGRWHVCDPQTGNQLGDVTSSLHSPELAHEVERIVSENQTQKNACECEWHPCQNERAWGAVAFCLPCFSDDDGREPCRIDVLEDALIALMECEGGEPEKHNKESAEVWNRARRAVYGNEARE